MGHGRAAQNAVEGGGEHRASPRLCITVDDFGLHAGVNEAVERLAAAGRVQACAAQVGGPAFAAGRPLLRQLQAAGLDIGLHLDLSEHPLTRAPQRLGALLRAAYSGRLAADSLREEIAAQLRAFEDALGRPPDFIDGHQHVHQLPGVRQALLQALQARTLAGGSAPWLRHTAPPPGLRAGLKPSLIGALGAQRLRQQARAQGLGGNRRLLGVYGFGGSPQALLRRLAQWLAAAGDGDLLMTHPACSAPPHDPIGPARVQEFEALTSADFGRLLQASGLRLQPMSRILAA